MALSWLTALKAVPWADVVQAAPGIVQGARKLFSAAKGYAGSAGDAHADTAETSRSDARGARLQQIESEIGALQNEQRSSAELIRSLAEQNATIIAALDLIRGRVRALTIACVALAIAVVALGISFVLR